MKSKNFRVSAGALALVVCLTVSPKSEGATVESGIGGVNIRERVVRIVKKLYKKLGDVRTLNEYPAPPKP